MQLLIVVQNKTGKTLASANLERFQTPPPPPYPSDLPRSLPKFHANALSWILLNFPEVRKTEEESLQTHYFNFPEVWKTEEESLQTHYFLETNGKIDGSTFHISNFCSKMHFSFALKQRSHHFVFSSLCTMFSCFLEETARTKSAYAGLWTQEVWK